MRTCLTLSFLLLILVTVSTAQQTLKPALILNQSGYSYDNMAFSPDDKMLAVYGESPVNIWNLENGELIQSIRPRNPSQSTALFSLDGSEILISSGRYITVYDVASGKIKASYRIETSLNGLAIQNEAKNQYTAKTTPQCYQDFSNAVLFSNGELLTMAGEDYGYAMIWSIKNKAPFLYLKLSLLYNSLSILVSPDNKRIAIKDNSDVQIWNIDEGFSGNTFVIQNRYAKAFSFSHDGSRMLVATYDKIRVYDSNNGALVEEIELGFNRTTRNLIEFARFSPDGAFFHANRTIWNLADDRIIAKLEHDATAQGSSLFSPNKKYLAQGTEDGDILIWDISKINSSTKVQHSLMH